MLSSQRNEGRHAFDIRHPQPRFAGRQGSGAGAEPFEGHWFTDSDLSHPIIGVANTWIVTMPCNYHLRDLAGAFKEESRRRRHAHGIQYDSPSATVSPWHGRNEGSLVSRESSRFHRAGGPGHMFGRE